MRTVGKKHWENIVHLCWYAEWFFFVLTLFMSMHRSAESKMFLSPSLLVFIFISIQSFSVSNHHITSCLLMHLPVGTSLPVDHRIIVWVGIDLKSSSSSKPPVLSTDLFNRRRLLRDPSNLSWNVPSSMPCACAVLPTHKESSAGHSLDIWPFPVHYFQLPSSARFFPKTIGCWEALL